jgi:hypothetical protein
MSSDDFPTKAYPFGFFDGEEIDHCFVEKANLMVCRPR